MIKTVENVIPRLCMSVYYVIPLTVVTPGIQPCAYYRASETGLTRVWPGSNGKVVLGGMDGETKAPVYICLIHLTNLAGLTITLPLEPIDADVRMYSAVASAESDASLAETFIANTGPHSFPSVVIPVSKNHARGLILLFEDTRRSGTAPDTYRALRATLDPEIKGSDGDCRAG